MCVIEISVLWLCVHKKLLLEFCMNTYKIKLDIAVAIKSVSNQYEMLLLHPFSSFCIIHFLKIISTITHFLRPTSDRISVQTILLLWSPEIYHQRQPLDPFVYRTLWSVILNDIRCLVFQSVAEDGCIVDSRGEA